MSSSVLQERSSFLFAAETARGALTGRLNHRVIYVLALLIMQIRLLNLQIPRIALERGF